MLTRGAAQEERTHDRTLATALPVLIVLLRPYRIIGHALVTHWPDSAYPMTRPVLMEKRLWQTTLPLSAQLPKKVVSQQYAPRQVLT
ncbi:hypothetical protein GL58_03345 [Comamonas testosteroni]|uniref:Uncharacterized protein n=1 Tax=Comamonas testosteroni TaxID=285 RepID=A0A0L7MQ50_COMTE|nr:hypothetical protein GL58_03345 [Comamonas testosteroni]